jgi:hypothetical protein
MAQDWGVHALVYFYSAGSDLPWAVLYWRLDLESADMTTEIIQRAGCTARVLAGQGYYHKGETLCQLEDTGNGYIAKFPSNRATHQDYYICLDYSQAYDLILALSAFKKELGFEE